MRATHALACIAGAGWLVIVAFATGSFLLSVVPGFAIILIGFGLAEAQSERERHAHNRDIERWNAYLRKAWAEGREPSDEEMPPIRPWDRGTAFWCVVMAVALIALLLIVAYTPMETIHDIREHSPYVEGGAR